MADPETIRLERTGGLNRLLAPSELWRYRDVAVQIAARDVKVRYRQTVLGAAWAVLQPVGTMVVFSIFFGRRRGHLVRRGARTGCSASRRSSRGRSSRLRCCSGRTAWSATRRSSRRSTSRASSSRPASRRRGSSTSRSAIVIVLVVVVAIAGYAAVGRAARGAVARRRRWSAAALGVIARARPRSTCAIATCATSSRSPSQLWLFATPIAYPSTLLARAVAHARRRSTRWRASSKASAGRCSASTAAPWTLIAVSAASAAVLLVGGLAYFGRVERSFADIV